MRKITVDTAAPIRLSRWLETSFPSMSKGTLLSALKDKDIRINGKRTGEDVLLQPLDDVTLYIDDARLDGPALEVVWHSPNIVVAVKPAGVSSKAYGEADMELLVSRWLAGKGEAPTAIACHRLDNQTGGLMMLARNPETEEAVRALMESGSIMKTYNCIVKGVPSPAHMVLTAYMRKDAARAFVTMFDKPVPGAKTAVTEVTLLQTDGTRSLLEVKLHTGRTHQIRAHLAHIGHPILGDDKYGDREFNRQYHARRQKLWACRLDFKFPPGRYPALDDLAGKTLRCEAPFSDEIANNKTE